MRIRNNKSRRRRNSPHDEKAIAYRLKKQQIKDLRDNELDIFRSEKFPFIH